MWASSFTPTPPMSLWESEPAKRHQWRELGQVVPKKPRGEKCNRERGYARQC